MTQTFERVALYFAPLDNTPLADFGQEVIGRHADKPRHANADCLHPDPDRWLRLTQAPAHYGFHATLKAPFQLSDSYTLSELNQDLSAFAANRPAIALEGLAPRKMSDFAALTLQQSPDVLQDFAFEVVQHFEKFRQQLSPGDRQRRLQQGLTDRQRDLLERFGYPFVGDEFRFHMTLSGKLGTQDDDYLQWLQHQYHQRVTQTPQLDQLAIYAQIDRRSPFIRIQSHALSG